MDETYKVKGCDGDWTIINSKQYTLNGRTKTFYLMKKILPSFLCTFDIIVDEDFNYIREAEVGSEWEEFEADLAIEYESFTLPGEEEDYSIIGNMSLSELKSEEYVHTNLLDQFHANAIIDRLQRMGLKYYSKSMTNRTIIAIHKSDLRYYNKMLGKE